MKTAISKDNNKVVSYWLICCAILVLSMIMLGGATRLTHSGLSMVEWKPVVGAIPPITHEDWLDEFDKYQQSPEYQVVNNGMTLSGFKKIFYFEYFHRLLGRLVGIVFLIPLIIFYFKGWLSKPLFRKLLLVFVVGGLQGFAGWYMVKSGLIDKPAVSQYRLVIHLGLAVGLYGYLIWLASGLSRYKKDFIFAKTQGKSLWLMVMVVMTFFMILSGGFVAGLKAGLYWNTFPTMGEYWLPPGLYDMTPFWLSAFENPTTVQFNHRVIAMLLTIGVIVTFFLMKKTNSFRIKVLSYLLLIIVAIQVGLGVTTLLYFVPISVALAHQFVAMGIFTTTLLLLRYYKQSHQFI